MFARGNEVRRPVVAGVFYPSGAQELESTVGALLSQATKRRELSGLCGLVTPHAGYVYLANSGRGLFASRPLE